MNNDIGTCYTVTQDTLEPYIEVVRKVSANGRSNAYVCTGDSRRTAFNYNGGCRVTMFDADRGRMYEADVDLTPGHEGKSFYTLIDPATFQHSLVMCKCKPIGERVAVRGHDLHIHHGVMAPLVIAREGPEALVKVAHSERIVLFFADGQIRHFVQNGGSLIELKSTLIDVVEFRIADALERMRIAIGLSNIEIREKKRRAVCYGMADFLAYIEVMCPDRDEADNFRQKVLEGFFYQLSHEDLLSVGLKLRAVLRQVDAGLNQSFRKKMNVGTRK